MRIAVFADVHGNRHALEAVLKSRGPGRGGCRAAGLPEEFAAILRTGRG